MREAREYWEELATRAGSSAVAHPIATAGTFRSRWLRRLMNTVQTLRFRRAIGQATGCKRFKRVLDLGCGAGRFGSPGYVGVDFSRHMLQMNRVEERVQASATALPFRAGSFDLVLSITVLIHIPPEEVADVAAEMKRVCVGTLLLVEPEPLFKQPDKPYRDGGNCYPHEYRKLFGRPKEQKFIRLPFSYPRSVLSTFEARISRPSSSA